jgi:hypothetical protein
MAQLSITGGPYFHGGVADLDVGDLLLPGAVLGVSERQLVSVTLDWRLAFHCARKTRGGGDVYEVAVEHPTVPTLRELARQVYVTPGMSFTTPRSITWPPRGSHLQTRRAVVVRVVHRGRRDHFYESRPLSRTALKTPKRRSDG